MQHVYLSVCVYVLYYVYTYMCFVCVCTYICVSYLPNPSAWAGYDTRSIFMRSLTGLNSEFSFS